MRSCAGPTRIDAEEAQDQARYRQLPDKQRNRRPKPGQREAARAERGTETLAADVPDEPAERRRVELKHLVRPDGELEYGARGARKGI